MHSLDKVISQALELSQSCLSQPWEKTDQHFRQKLLEWQTVLNETATALDQHDSTNAQNYLDLLNRCIQSFQESLRTRNCILLSHTLADQWIPVLQSLSAQKE